MRDTRCLNCGALKSEHLVARGDIRFGNVDDLDLRCPKPRPPIRPPWVMALRLDGLADAFERDMG